jgi:hypothetical protein
MNKTIAVYHRADFDGLFCREIAKKFLPEAELIGWDFGDKPLEIPSDKQIYVMDLPVDRVFGFEYHKEDVTGKPPQHPAGLVWIDHHASSIETHPSSIPGYRIDGVAACRLAWQWFTHHEQERDEVIALPTKEQFVDRTVSEPLAVQLAGEYDIWDKRNPNAELFQHGLRSKELLDFDWKMLLDNTVDKTLEGTGMEQTNSALAVAHLLERGRSIQFVQTEQNASIIKAYGFDVRFEGLNFLACNHARFNSLLFTAGLKPEHDALLGFNFDGPKNEWRVSLYHAPGKEHHDLSVIATKHGGGGHRGACGFRMAKLPFIA